MCGIWALFGGCESNEDAKKLCTSSMRIAHRGPDAFRIESLRCFHNSYLAFFRLAIMDLESGMQPMNIRNYPHIWLLVNGEIYNYLKVQNEFGFDYETKCDAESIIHLYARGGIEFATSMLDGVFAFCLVDTKEKKVFIARDTYGIKPLFRLFQKENGVLAICSEGKGLLDVSKSNGGYKGIVEPFRPGTFASYTIGDDGKAGVVESGKQFHTVGNHPKWTSICDNVEVNGDVLSNIRLLLTEAVRKRLMATRRIGCLLSGGLDSSITAALVAKLAVESGIKYPIQTFSIGMEGSTDVAAARKVAAHINSEHHEILFTSEEGTEILEDVIYALESYDIGTIRASAAMYLLSRYINKTTNTTVIISGEGADELAQGFIHFHKAPSDEAASEESKRLLKDLYFFDVLRADRTTAAHGLEIRVPFLDHQFTSYYLSLPAKIRQPTQGVEKYLLRKAFEGMDLLPNDILWRPKESFGDGVSSNKKSWHKILQQYGETKVTDEMMDGSNNRFSFNPPQTKEAYLYRDIFECHYPNCGRWIPYSWFAKWVNTKDPSPREIAHYREIHVSPV